MINRDYRQKYEQLFQFFVAGRKANECDESALPSYVHPNRMMSALFWKRIDTALRLAEDLTDKRILDFGAGGGVLFRYLKERHCRITACEKHFSSLTAEVGRALDIPIELIHDLRDVEGQQYDRIFALDVLEHVEQLELCIEQLIGACHERGRIILSGPTENRLYKLGRRMAGFSGHYHVRNIYQVEKIFKERGCRRIQVRHLYPILTFFRVTVWEKAP
jgi:2-polyprenyl-3-methyl-5-hydroxy-6-metoxy-1,4-benzoquinol methylase